MEKVIKLLENFKPSCEQERIDKDLFLQCARDIPNILTRESLLAHFTSSAFVINDAKTKVVCSHHNIYDSWTWLGGHADGEDDFFGVAKREVGEESGLTRLKTFGGGGVFSIESLPVLSHTRKGKFVPAHTHLNVTYAFTANEDDKLHNQPDENSQTAWLTFDELIKESTENYMIPVYKKLVDRIKEL